MKWEMFLYEKKQTDLGDHEVAKLVCDDLVGLAVKFRIIEANVNNVNRFLSHWE